MKLPVIRHIASNPEFDVKNLKDTVDVLISIADARGIKDEELGVIGELVSNLEGAINVKNQVKLGTPLKDALNNFMKRVFKAVNN